MLDFKAIIGDTATETKFVIGETTFQIQRLLPMEGYYVLEELRAGVGGELSRLDFEGSSDVALMAGVIAAIPPATLESVRKKMFAEVWFTNSLSPKPRRVHPDEGSAFKGLHPMSIYEVQLRAFLVNFIESFTALASYFRADPLASE